MMRLPAIVLVGCVLLLALSADALPKRFHQSGMHRPVVRRGMAAASDPQEQYYNTQTIDHFSADGKGVFKQRFFVNDTYWGGAGYPVFLILGGEGPISVSDVTNHFIIPQYAAAYNALVISLEHRFYGLTQPFPDTSVDNLLYLTSNQALADIAQFTTWFTQEYKTGDAPWISWGGSYSGALAAWYRLKYPQLTAGAIASSAPVEAILEFSEYLVTVGNDLDRTCYNIVANATQQIETLLSTNPSQLETLFETCTPIKQSDWSYFMEAITDPLAGIAQYSNDNVDYQPFNVSTMCSMLKNISSDPVTAYAGVVKAINQFNGARCTDISYDAYIDFLSITALNDTAARSWTWQTCTEFGYFQTGSASNQPFSSLINLQLFENICSDAFSPQYTVPNTNWTNTYYGGAKNSGTLIAFPNGEVDPWHNLGVLQPNNRFESSLIMSDTAHCADLYPASSHDPHDLRVTREQEQELVSMWINNFHSKPTL